MWNLGGKHGIWILSDRKIIQLISWFIQIRAGFKSFFDRFATLITIDFYIFIDLTIDLNFVVICDLPWFEQICKDSYCLPLSVIFLTVMIPFNNFYAWAIFSIPMTIDKHLLQIQAQFDHDTDFVCITNTSLHILMFVFVISVVDVIAFSFLHIKISTDWGLKVPFDVFFVNF